jgi:urease accessory protein
MFDAPAHQTHQRAQGELHVRLGRRGDATVLHDLRQQGCLKARFPRTEAWHETVTLNTSGGIAGGDRLASRFDVEPGARATFASQAAERFYRALPGDPAAEIRTTITVAPGAAAEWLPQEAILFDSCALDRRLDIGLAADAFFLGLETLVFGRTASGETLRTLRLRDTIAIRRAGRRLLHDAIRLDGTAAPLTATAGANNARAVATLVLVAPDAEARLDPLRAAWADSPVETGASAWNGMLLARLLAPDAARLRAAVIAGLTVLRDGRPLPRVWMC